MPPGAPLPAEIQAQLRPGCVVLHAPSMWAYKQWPLAHFRELAAQLLARGVQIVLTGSAAARDQECVAALLDLASPPQLVNAAGRLDFNQLVTLFKQAALYIGPDTSVSHLAAGCGVPTLAIFGPTNPMRWAPWPGSCRGADPLDAFGAVADRGQRHRAARQPGLRALRARRLRRPPAKPQRLPGVDHAATGAGRGLADPGRLAGRVARRPAGRAQG